MKAQPNAIYIVTPSFNSISTIERTLLSVLSQAGDFDLHYHVQDGGSTDGTVMLVHSWIEKLNSGAFPIHCRSVKLTVDRSPDEGMYDALVKGFSRFPPSPDAFMTWINSDDLLMPGALALISDAARGFDREQLSWLSGMVAVMNGDSPQVMLDRPLATEVIKAGLCDGRHWDFVQQEGTFFRRWLWDAVEPEKNFRTYKLAGDWNLWRLFAQKTHYVQTDWPLGVFRKSDYQLSRLHFDKYMNEIEATLPAAQRMKSLSQIAESGSARRLKLIRSYPDGHMSIVESDISARTDFFFQKVFGKKPGASAHSKTRSGKRVLFEAAREEVEILTEMKPENFDRFTYARKPHLRLFKGLDVKLFGMPRNPEQEQLKVYQDLFVLRFIEDNIPPGSRILDVGGGKSRILEHLSGDYECWNIDKLEGLGNGPKEIDNLSYRLVRDYMGNFNTDLEDDYFDLVFSISALEHVPQDDEGWFECIVEDIERVMKPGAFSLHLFDVILKPDFYWTNKFTDYIFENINTINKPVTPDEMRADPEFFAMSEQAYNRTWLHTTKRPYAQHGKPSSLNILWRKG